MPTYVYECERCGQRFELMQGISDPPRQRCPECRGKVKRVVLSGGGLIFKGSGFYITDYKRKPEAPREDAAAPSSPPREDSPKKEAPAPAAGETGAREASGDKGKRKKGD